MSTALSDAELLDETARNHRAWFRRGAAMRGGTVAEVDGAELCLGRDAILAFPPPGFDPDATVALIRKRGCRGAGCWSLAEDPALGARLVARGFTWGWEPHWMACDLAPGANAGATVDADAEAGTDGEPAAHEVIAATPPYAETLPYAPGPDGDGNEDGIDRLGVRLGEKIVGQVVVQPLGGVAGIYDMGVVPKVRRRGIGAALTRAASHRAAERGCRYATLNATDEGQLLYSALGFRSLGRGRTWWYREGPPPSARQIDLAEAIGLGDLARLADLDPSAAELGAPLAGGTSPLRLAVLTGQTAVAAALLDRAPGLATLRFEPHGGTLLHIAVEADDAELVRMALDRGVDPGARDSSFDGTALEWAEHLGHASLAAPLGDAA